MRFLIASVFVLLFLTESANAQDEREPFHALIRSMEWSKNVGPMDLSIVAHDTRNAQLPSMDGSYSDGIHRFEIVRDASNAFMISYAYGLTNLKMVNGEDRIGEISFGSVTDGTVESAKSTYLPSREAAAFRCPHEGKSCFDIALGTRWELSTLPFKYTYALPDENLQSNFDFLVEYLNSVPKSNVHIEQTRDELKRRVTVYRIKRSIPRTEDAERKAVTLRIDVSNEGVDRDLVVGIRQGSMKLDKLNEPYESENQVNPFPLYSSTIEWKQVKTNQDPESQVILPVRIVYKLDQSPYGKCLQNVTLKWNSINAPNQQLPSKKQCEDTVVRLNKEINKVLRR